MQVEPFINYLKIKESSERLFCVSKEQPILTVCYLSAAKEAYEMRIKWIEKLNKSN